MRLHVARQPRTFDRSPSLERPPSRSAFGRRANRVKEGWRGAGPYLPLEPTSTPGHYRGLAKVELHCLLALVTLQAKAIVQAENGGELRECLRKVA